MTYISRFVSLTVATVRSSASGSGSLPPMSHLAAIGLLVATRAYDGSWQFELLASAVGAGDGEDRLLAWVTEALPDSGIVVGWQLAEAIVPPLLDAGTAGDPEIGRAFLDRLLRLVTASSVDLAIPHGGAAALPVAAVAAARGLATMTTTTAEVESAWAFGNTRRLIKHVEAEAVATWRLWLAEANGTAAAASEAFETWWAKRSG